MVVFLNVDLRGLCNVTRVSPGLPPMTTENLIQSSGTSEYEKSMNEWISNFNGLKILLFKSKDPILFRLLCALQTVNFLQLLWVFSPHRGLVLPTAQL